MSSPAKGARLVGAADDNDRVVSAGLQQDVGLPIHAVRGGRHLQTQRLVRGHLAAKRQKPSHS